MGQVVKSYAQFPTFIDLYLHTKFHWNWTNL